MFNFSNEREKMKKRTIGVAGVLIVIVFVAVWVGLNNFKHYELESVTMGYGTVTREANKKEIERTEIKVYIPADIELKW